MKRFGDHALLWELPDNPAVHAAARVARKRFGDQLVEVVPGDQTLLLVWDEGLDDAAALVTNLKALANDAGAFLDALATGDEPAQLVSIPVIYDGPDLAAVAAALALDDGAVVQLHTGGEYTVAFTGFSPGFPYLRAARREGASGADGESADLQRLLALPRIDTPRTQVPAGAVAVAAGYCGIYPRSSPGGWNLLGHTEVALFDAGRDPPALLAPGTHVRFERAG